MLILCTDFTECACTKVVSEMCRHATFGPSGPHFIMTRGGGGGALHAVEDCVSIRNLAQMLNGCSKTNQSCGYKFRKQIWHDIIYRKQSRKCTRIIGTCLHYVFSER